MLDLFTIFSKGGIVLWCFQSTTELLTPSVNALIKSVILPERGGNNSFNHDKLTLKYKLDNEFELVYVVAYQKILMLSYVDKFLNAIQMEFRDKYKDDLKQANLSRNFDFFDTYHRVLKEIETSTKNQAKTEKVMRTFEESQKSKKTISSMIENKSDEPKSGKKKNKENKESKAAKEAEPVVNTNATSPKPTSVINGTPDEETIRRNRERFMQRGMRVKSPDKSSPKATTAVKKVKQGRKWDNGGTSKDAKELDYSSAPSDVPVNGAGDGPSAAEKALVGQMVGPVRNMVREDDADEYEMEEEPKQQPQQQQQKNNKNTSKKSGGFGFLSGLRSLISSKALTRADIEPALAKMKDHLIVKNVAAEIADKLCESVATKLEGKVLGSFNTVASTVRQLLQEACIQVLSPKRRLDVLRDAMEARAQGRPYTLTFCGVNGVGKSTNLAKVCFWLVENGLRVLIAACDTFRAGAVEQLRTHEQKLNALHPASSHGGVQMVKLYEKGYGKDAAGIAMEAINAARDMKYDVVLIDTAGRMQDNEPLMRALAKLVKVNQPDLVLFVGEALVGNEAIDQLTKFNQALADHSQMEHPRLIDGIVLTKFDTIDDKVGAAISMTYITGQPIVFVGTGQTYADLKNLDSRAVVNALLRP